MKGASILHSKRSYTKYTRTFKRVRACARFKNGIWCMDLAYVDILGRKINGVNLVLVLREDMFDRTVFAKRMKTKDCNETIGAFWTTILENTYQGKLELKTEQKLLDCLKKLGKAEGIHICLPRSETRAAFAWLTIQSIKNDLLLHGRLWMQVHSKIVSILFHAKF